MEELLNTILQFGKIISRDSTVTYEERAATMLQFSALRQIEEHKGTTVSELGSSLHLSKSSTTQLVDRLVKRQILKRTHDATDRRIVRITLTEHGVNELKTLKHKMLEKMKRIFSHLPNRDIQELTRIHTDIINSLNKEKNA